MTRIPTYWGSDDTETWGDEVTVDPFDIEPGAFYKSTYDLYDASQPRVPKGSSGGGRFASTHGYKLTKGRDGKPIKLSDMSAYDLYDRSQPRVPKGSSAGGQFASKGGTHSALDVPGLRSVEPQHSTEWPTFHAAYETPGGNLIEVTTGPWVDRGTPPSAAELTEAASTVDMISARTNRPVTVRLWQDANMGEATGWFNDDNPQVVNINLRRVREGQAARDAAPDDLRAREWHMPVRSSVGGIAYTVAHEAGHDYDCANPGKKKRAAAARRSLREYDRKHMADRPDGWATRSGLSTYGHEFGPGEAYAELFAEWMLTGGKTQVPAARLYAEMLDWP